MSDDNDLEVYIFEGNDGEQVPQSVEKLIIEEGVQELPFKLCYEYERLREVTLPDGLLYIGNLDFYLCGNLLEINICSTVRIIGMDAFSECKLLAKVEFECSPSSPHQLQTIDERAFWNCASLQRIKLPSSLTTVDRGAFWSCALMEINLSTTCITHLSQSAFGGCRSLQTASLPITLERIGNYAFHECFQLVTVVVPLDTLHPIMIGEESFYGCVCLANLVLPKDSTAEEDSFDGCGLLDQRYGETSSHIIAGLVERFEDFPIHRMCYAHSAITVREFRQCVAEEHGGGVLLDTLGMTPFHILFSTIEPRVELLSVLLNSLPNQMLGLKDANDKRPLDYLINNWTDGAKTLLLRALQSWMIDPLAHWGDMKWSKAMKTMVGELLFEHDEEQRLTLLNEMYSAFGRYEKMESTSILELALWKCKLKSGWNNGGSKRQALDRVECRCVCGSDVLIPNVTRLLLG